MLHDYFRFLRHWWEMKLSASRFYILLWVGKGKDINIYIHDLSVIWTNEKIKQSKRARDIDVIVHREQCRIWYWEETFPKINIDELLLMVILFSQSLLVMVYFMYQLDWAMGCPNRWWNIISKGVLSMFLEEIRLWMYRMSKADCTPLMWWASSISIEGLNQTKRKVKVKFVLWLTVELEYQFTPGFCSLGS